MEITFRISDAGNQPERFRCRSAPPFVAMLHNFFVRTKSGGDYVNNFQSFHYSFEGVAVVGLSPIGKSKSRKEEKCRGKKEPESTEFSSGFL